ncbi:F-box only protein 16 [Oopsacas minuta]|uniref:F-box only protein 16 n=1 Tax=Oopsacas minuta TaxID=111878 RepID=A0AAV7K1S5_9METZ|nr:F-box only protein 16 [Oopsacas minuta]
MSTPSLSAMEPVYSHASMRSIGLSLSQLSHASLKQMSGLSASHASIHSATSRGYLDGTGGPSSKALFRERMELCLEWFNSWTDGQRRKYLSCLGICFKPSELLQLASLVELKAPKEQLDFTNILTKDLSLRIFSYLDPRSLCRCSQVIP